ncbi:hypothetical protein Dimus_022055 [Dionaea muscipula]
MKGDASYLSWNIVFRTSLRERHQEEFARLLGLLPNAPSLLSEDDDTMFWALRESDMFLIKSLYMKTWEGKGRG